MIHRSIYDLKIHDSNQLWAQLQERLTDQVATALEEALNPRGVFVMVEAEHMCMTMRGIKKPGSKTITTVAKGIYKEDREERKEILSLMRDF